MLPVSTVAAALLALAPAPWTEVSPGLDHREVSALPDAVTQYRLHAYRVDLRRYRPVVAQAPSKDSPRATVKDLAEPFGAHLAVNGTFFDERWRPLGLLVRDKKVLNPLRRADWGVLSVIGAHATLVHTRAFSADDAAQVDFAIQVGPRAVVDGRPVKLKPQLARRTAIGILADERTLVVVVSEGLVESNDLARVLAAPAGRGGLGCHQALMLDGGPSSQLYARVGEHHRAVAGGYGVPNAVVFVPAKR